MEAFKGGPGSGNFGHAGRPGKKGGSSPKGGGVSASISGGDHEYENAMDMGRSMESDGFGAGRGQREPLGDEGGLSSGRLAHLTNKVAPKAEAYGMDAYENGVDRSVLDPRNKMGLSPDDLGTDVGKKIAKNFYKGWDSANLSDSPVFVLRNKKTGASVFAKNTREVDKIQGESQDWKIYGNGLFASRRDFNSWEAKRILPDTNDKTNIWKTDKYGDMTYPATVIGKNKEVSATPTGVPGHGQGGLFSQPGLGGAKQPKIKIKKSNRNIREEAEDVGNSIRRKMGI
jgi:hypothetical protein